MAADKHTVPAEAQSTESLISQALALRPMLERVLAGIDTALDQGRAAAEGVPIPAAEARSCGASDRTDNQIRAYLASMRSTRDVDYRHDIAEANARGKSYIERLAISADGDDMPRMRLTAGEMADVLSFMSCTEPVDLESWWKDTYDGPSWVCGYHAVLRALEQSLRGEQRPVAEPAPESADPALGDVPAIPVAPIEDDISERLMNAAGIVGTVRNALDEDCAEESAALSVAVSMLHKIDDDLDHACYQATKAWDLAHPDHPDAIERRRVLEGMQTATKAWDIAHPDHPDAIERRRVLEGMQPAEEAQPA